MKNPSKEVLGQAITMREAGKSHKEIMVTCGLSHSQMERHFMAADLESGKIKGGFLSQPESNTEKAAIVARLRNAGESWGLISVRFKEPEGRTRKVFKETGLDSQGLRIGRGGRYLADDPRFYVGADRPKLGTELKAGVPALNQVPDPEAEPKRVLPKLAQGTKPKAARVRKATKKVAKATA